MKVLSYSHSRVHVIWHFMEDLRAMVQQFGDPQHCELCPYTNPNVDKMAKVSLPETFFPLYIVLISAFTAQMALLGFIFSSLYLSRNVSPNGQGLPLACQRERER